MKKILSLVLVFVMLVSLFPAAVYAEDQVVDEQPHEEELILDEETVEELTEEEQSAEEPTADESHAEESTEESTEAPVEEPSVEETTGEELAENSEEEPVEESGEEPTEESIDETEEDLTETAVEFSDDGNGVTGELLTNKGTLNGSGTYSFSETALSGGGTYYLSANIKLAGPIVIKDNAEVTIDLNNEIIKEPYNKPEAQFIFLESNADIICGSAYETQLYRIEPAGPA